MPLGVAGWASLGTAVIGAAGSASARSDAKSAGAAAASSQQAQDLIAMQQQVQANEQWNRYKSVYAPLEDSFAQEAQNYGSVANQNKAAGQAAAATTSAYANARDRLSKTPGLSPTSQRYLQAMNGINLGEAASSATGQNDARDKVVTQGAAREADALNIGKGLAASGMAGLAGAAGTYGASVKGNQSLQQGYANQAAGQASGIGSMVGGIVNSKGFQNWLNNDTYSGLTSNATNNGYGDTFQQNGLSADIAYG